jgi:uncharacterized membrane protein
MPILIKIATYFLWFYFYSIIGWIYDTSVRSIPARRYINGGFLNGPYCPIYGFGGILVIWLLNGVNNWWQLFILGSVLTCTLEYITSWLMEKLFKARWWDYSHNSFNINGRICLLGAIAFGSLSVLLIKIIHPIIMGWTSMIPNSWIFYTATIIFLTLIIDFVLTIRSFDQLKKNLSNLEKSIFLNLNGKKFLLKNWKKFLKSNIWSQSFKKILKENKIYERYIEPFSKHLSIQQKRLLNAFPDIKLKNRSGLLEEIRKIRFIKHKNNK